MPFKGKNNKHLKKSTCEPHKLNELCTNSNNGTTLTPELEQQFEIELCWCIQELQTALKSGKLNNKQVQDHRKALNTLMNTSAPMVQKRQVMRLSFGDYRAKMAAEEKKSSRNAINMRVKPAIPSKKSVFVKKSAFTLSSGNAFQFNFQPTINDDLNDSRHNVHIEMEENASSNDKGNTFVPSDNTFRFNFDIVERL